MTGTARALTQINRKRAPGLGGCDQKSPSATGTWLRAPNGPGGRRGEGQAARLLSSNGPAADRGGQAQPPGPLTPALPSGPMFRFPPVLRPCGSRCGLLSRVVKGSSSLTAPGRWRNRAGRWGGGIASRHRAGPGHPGLLTGRPAMPLVAKGGYGKWRNGFMRNDERGFAVWLSCDFSSPVLASTGCSSITSC